MPPKKKATQKKVKLEDATPQPTAPAKTEEMPKQAEPTPKPVVATPAITMEKPVAPKESNLPITEIEKKKFREMRFDTGVVESKSTAEMKEVRILLGVRNGKAKND